MNKLDKTYQDLLQDILDNGVTKQDRTKTGTISVFGRQIRHKMSEGFPLLTTKKMPWKTIVTELLWFLRGDTNIKYLVDNGCNIWNGDAYKNYCKEYWNLPFLQDKIEYGSSFYNHDTNDYTFEELTQEEFINKIKTDEEFANKWGDLGPIYGKQWRSWTKFEEYDDSFEVDILEENEDSVSFSMGTSGMVYEIDQIQNSIDLLKTDPDSRRNMVSAWNVGELDQMVLPPCHYGFQVYTRELSISERYVHLRTGKYSGKWNGTGNEMEYYDSIGVPKRAISLMWNQRSVDTFLGLPFNIASYGLLLEIIAKEVNMVPDELIGNLGDVHLYSNHIVAAKEQIGWKMDLDERKEYSKNPEFYQDINGANWSSAMGLEALKDDHKKELHSIFDEENVPKRTREPFPLPTLKELPDYLCIKENWECYEIDDIKIENYQSHPTIKAPLSN